MDKIKIDEAIKRDKNIQDGYEEFRKLDQQANSIAEEISATIVESIVADKENFNISTAVLAVAKTLSHLSSYLYDTEEEFLNDVKKARTSVVSDIIPALLAPEPCGICDNCKNGKPHECLDPKVRADYTTSRFLPILCNMLIEYDMFNKVLYMYTVGKEETESDVAFEESQKEE